MFDGISFHTIHLIYRSVDPIFLWYFSSINAMYVVLLFFGCIKVYKRNKEISLEDFTHIVRSNSLPEITFVIPAYNEAAHISAIVDNLLNLTYLYKQIIIVNDGSKDNTLEILKKKLHLIKIPLFYKETLPTKPIRGVYQSQKHADVLVIDKENGKKFDALNAGINAAQNPYFIALDADTFIDSSSFLALIRPILTDPKLIAVGASIRIKNGCTLEFNRISTYSFPQKILPAFQSLEYLRSFLERQGWDYLGGNFVLAGAFGIFKKEAVVKAGGYVDTVAEDMEIIIRLHRVMREAKIPYKIMYLPDPVAWTEAPEKLKELSRQRANWHRGLLDCLWFHKQTLFNPIYGVFGFFIYPFWLWSEAIESTVEMIGLIYIVIGFFLGVVHFPFVLLFLVVTCGFTVLYTGLCILIEELSFKKYLSFKSLVSLLIVNLFENFGYRQLNLVWRLIGNWNFLRDWHRVQKNSKTVNFLIKKARRTKAA